MFDKSKKSLKLNTNGLLRWCKSKSQTALEILAICMALAGVGLLAAKSPDIHSGWVRHKVGAKVYTIRDGKLSGQGTGFAVKAPSGASYVLTNDHVCGVARDGQNLSVIDSDGNEIRRKILARSGYSDLCLIEGIPGVDGLALGSEPKLGQAVASVGHPAGYGITMSKGEIIDHEDIMMMMGPIEFQDPTGAIHQVPAEQGGISPAQCSAPKNSQIIREVNQIFFTLKVKFCIVTIKEAMRTNVLVQPGNSGSPLVDFWGNVVGVIFAEDNAQWGAATKLQDIKDFLKLY